MLKILVVNDDGIRAESLWVLARELKRLGKVTVVAPETERSASGTAVTLFAPLRVTEFPAPLDGVKSYATDGSPSDCVILALGKLMKDGADIVVSGINPNLNLGEDVYISGTVGAAMQGYFRGLPALAISAPPGSRTGIATGARFAAVLAAKVLEHRPVRIFLNVNVPDLALEEVRGLKLTRLARASHINTVAENEYSSERRYQLVRERLDHAGDAESDIRAVMDGYISITPLYTSLLDKPPQRLLKRLIGELNEALKR
ncbi:MAG: 5'/3'-nucleotidase SurE [Dehalococcoidales bacterium]|nr:5'/3'-nucleotidase SurE [Dehalococcoidales bacterium]